MLSIVAVLALAAKNMVRSTSGRAWMAVRDMDVAAEVIGIRLMRAKLLAFAVSSFYCGVAGALFAFAYLGTVEPEAFNLDLSFRILFMVIIGGVGSDPRLVPRRGVHRAAADLAERARCASSSSSLGLHVAESTDVATSSSWCSAALIIFFLIVEPHGLARLWQIGKEKLRLWPFPH